MNEPIRFFDLIKIFDKYGYDFVGEHSYMNKGTRFELSGKGDFEKMIQEIKKKSNDPDKILDGGDSHHKYAPEITRKSIIVLDLF